jgi:deoxycytidine triphosphate deaminase
VSSPHFQDYLLPAESDQEAERRFRIAKSLDPFPQIPPSLLNSADIHDYVRMTGMLYPYESDDLKSASYEAPIYWKCIVWDERGERCDLHLEEGKDEEITLKANSIALVQVKPHFRLPDYIALRFNLKIKHVHRGILLGTGPLVDPGFEGKLVIPLHNLTTNNYTFRRGEGLIWVEFTKTTISTEVSDSHSALRRRGSYRPFPDDKKNHDPDWYIEKATRHKPIRSSIPDALRQGLDAAKEAEVQAKEAEAGAKRVGEYVKFLSIGGGIVLLLTLGTLAFQTWGLIGDAWKAVSDVQQFIQSSRQDDRDRRLDELQKYIETSEKRMTEKIIVIEGQLDQLIVDARQTGSKRTETNQQAEQGLKTR